MALIRRELRGLFRGQELVHALYRYKRGAGTTSAEDDICDPIAVMELDITASILYETSHKMSLAQLQPITNLVSLIRLDCVIQSLDAARCGATDLRSRATQLIARLQYGWLGSVDLHGIACILQRRLSCSRMTADIRAGCVSCRCTGPWPGHRWVNSLARRVTGHMRPCSLKHVYVMRGVALFAAKLLAGLVSSGGSCSLSSFLLLLLALTLADHAHQVIVLGSDALRGVQLC